MGHISVDLLDNSRAKFRVAYRQKISLKTDKQSYSNLDIIL